MAYKLNRQNGVQRDGASLPCRYDNGRITAQDEHSPFVKEFQKWVAEGNVPEPYVEPAQTAEQINAPIVAEMAANDIKAIRALVDGDTARIEAHRMKQAALRARLK